MVGTSIFFYGIEKKDGRLFGRPLDSKNRGSRTAGQPSRGTASGHFGPDAYRRYTMAQHRAGHLRGRVHDPVRHIEEINRMSANNALGDESFSLYFF